MSKPRKKPAAKPRPKKSRPAALAESGIRLLYEEACHSATRGKNEEAYRLYDQLAPSASDPNFKALLANDRAALAAMTDDLAAARLGFQEALKLDPTCEPARQNLAALDEEEARIPAPQPALAAPPVAAPATGYEPGPIRVAILSFLFNWPSTGGGIVHTVELECRHGQHHQRARSRRPAERSSRDTPDPQARTGLGRGRAAFASRYCQGMGRPRLRANGRLPRRLAANARSVSGLPMVMFRDCYRLCSRILVHSERSAR